MPTPLNINPINPGMIGNDSNLLGLIANLPSKLEDMSTARTQRQAALMDLALAPAKLKAQEARTQAMLRKIDQQDRLNGLIGQVFERKYGMKLNVGMPLASEESSAPIENLVYGPQPAPTSEFESTPTTSTGGEDGLVPVIDLGDMEAIEAQQPYQPQAQFSGGQGGGDEELAMLAMLMSGSNPQGANALSTIAGNDIRQEQIDINRQRLEFDKEKESPEFVGDVARVKAGEERRGKYFDAQYEASDKVVSALPEIEVLKSNLDDLSAKGDATGPASSAVTFLNNAGQQLLGLDLKLSPSSQYEQIEAASNRLATPLAKMLGVNPTDFDFKNIKATMAGIGKSMAGNYALYDVQRQAITREQHRQDILNKLEQDGASLPEIRKTMAKFNAKQHIIPSKAAPKNISDLKKGQRYVNGRGVWIFNGKDFDEASY